MVVYLCVFKYETLWPGVADHVMLAEDCMQLCWLCVCDVGRRLHAAVLAVCVCDVGRRLHAAVLAVCVCVCARDE